MKIYVKLWIKTYEKCALLRKSNLEKTESIFFYVKFSLNYQKWNLVIKYSILQDLSNFQHTFFFEEL